MDVSGDKSKMQCCKEQYCIGTWNVRSVNQGKLEVVKQEMARVNISILGISELDWNGLEWANLIQILISSLTPKILMFTLAISCVAMSNLP